MRLGWPFPTDRAVVAPDSLTRQASLALWRFTCLTVLESESYADFM